jgi:hypothetical protein
MSLNPFRSDDENPLNLEPEPPSSRGFWIELIGGVLLVGGLAGFGVYQWLTEPPLLVKRQNAGPAPTPHKQPSPKPSSLPTTLPTTSATPGSSDKSPPAELYQAMPKSGVYYAINSALAASRREVASENGRFCIKLVDAPKEKQAGETRTLVSSVSSTPQGLYVDALQEKLTLDRNNNLIQDRLGSWQWLQSKVDRSGAMAECLAKTTPYRQLE